VGVLVVPSVVVGKIAEACCGVEPENLEVEAPGEACVCENVTISINYTVVRSWIPPPDILPYNTGYLITIYDSADNPVDSANVTLATAQPDPLPVGVNWTDTYDFHPTEADTYTYEVAAWSWTTAGTMTTDIVAGEIVAEECFDIDIKPGSDPNSINPKSKGVIPVAILGSADFDVTTVDPDSVTFGPTGTEAPPVRWAIEDVNIDSFFDVVFHFKTQECGFSAGDETGTLTCDQGSASDSVNIVPKGK